MLKSTVLAFVFIFTGIFSITAQKSKGFDLGGNIGYNTSAATSLQGILSTTELSSYNIAVHAEYYFSDRWSIKSKLILDNKGWGNGIVIGQNANIILVSDVRLTYLTLPIMANWHFGSTRKWYLHFGMFTGVLLKATALETGEDIKNSINNIDLGMAVGIGYKFPIAEKTSLMIEYDGQVGFLNTLRNDRGDAARNTRVSINLGVIFDL